MKSAIAIFLCLMLAVSGISAHANGMLGSGASEHVHHSMGEAHNCIDDATSVASSKSERHSHDFGCVAGHCAVACGFLPHVDIELGQDVTLESHWIVSEAQTDGLDLTFDPPPPRA